MVFFTQIFHQETNIESEVKIIMCKDSNNTVLSVGDAVMYIDNNGREFEGTIIALLKNNKIKIDCETGPMIVDAAYAFILP